MSGTQAFTSCRHSTPSDISARNVSPSRRLQLCIDGRTSRSSRKDHLCLVFRQSLDDFR
jgi:hypothetical protein